MSYTSLYGVPSQGSLETVAEYGNSWGSAPVIWEFVWNKYLRTPETERYESFMYPQKNLEAICRLANEGKLHEFEAICVKLTFDKCMIRKEDFPRVAEALNTMYLATATFQNNRSNHLKAIANDLLTANNWNNYIGCCFRHTSVGDEWGVRSDEDGESRLYDVSRDEGHWFLFDAVDEGDPAEADSPQG